VDPKTGTQTVLSAGGSLTSPRGLGVQPDGGILVADQNAFSGTGGLIRLDPATGAQSAFATGGSFTDPAGIAVLPNKAPKASFSIAPNPALTTVATTFDGSTSSDSDGSIANYSWDLDGDGTYETNTGTSPTVQKTFPAAGDVRVGLRVTDDSGATADIVRTFPVYDLQPPQLGLTVDAFRMSGHPFVREPGEAKFQPLRSANQIRVGAEIDTNDGTVRILASAGGTATQTGTFDSGAFLIQQKPVKHAVTELVLTDGRAGSPPGAKPAPKPKRKTKAKAKAKKAGVKVICRKRKLWAAANGRFKTRGRFAAATVRGTQWLTSDTCSSTTIQVKRGAVLVVDLVTRKTRVVQAGHSYTARGKMRASMR
jgi:hypothetical protein